MLVKKSERISCVPNKIYETCYNINLDTASSSYKKDKYLGSIINDSVTMYDEIIAYTNSTLTKSPSTKTVPIKSNSKNLSILLAFLLITIAFSGFGK